MNDIYFSDGEKTKKKNPTYILSNAFSGIEKTPADGLRVSSHGAYIDPHRVRLSPPRNDGKLNGGVCLNPTPHPTRRLTL